MLAAKSVLALAARVLREFKVMVLRGLRMLEALLTHSCLKAHIKVLADRERRVIWVSLLSILVNDLELELNGFFVFKP